MVPLTVEHLLWRMSNVHPASEVVSITGGAECSQVLRCPFPEVAARARRLAAGARSSLAIRPGDIVAVLAFNTVEHLEVLLGIPLLGAAVNSLNARLDADVLIEQMLSPLPAAVVVDAEMVQHPVLGENARKVLSALDRADIPVIAVGHIDWAEHSHAFAHYEELVADDHPPVTESVEDENAIAYLFHTSGTTGRPKSYSVTHRAALLHTLSQATTEATGLRSDDRVLPLAPFFHVNGWGLPLTSALTGASLVLCGGDLAPARIASILDEESITVAAAVPTVWHDVCSVITAGHAPKPRHLREIFSGGSVVPQPVVDAVASVLGATVSTAWGMTETMACSTYERAEPASSAGKPIPLVEIRIDGSGFDHVPGHPVRGTLEVRGPFIVGVHDSDTEWFDTGDIASIGSDGRLSLHDRAKDLIKSGGEWIASAELEQYLCTHPSVSAAAIVAMAHPRWIERPLAYIVTTEANINDIEAALRAYVGERFPRYWIPDLFIVVDELPRTAVGKVDKARLRLRASIETEKRSEAIA